jgi:trk system potassium uptake protein TrkH
VYLAPVARVLAGFAAFFSLAQLLPLAYALLERADPAAGVVPVAGFGASLLAGSCTALLLWLASRGHSGRFYHREGISVVAGAWLLAGLLGAIPYVWSGAIPSPVDALFETLSGLTTTGASVLGTAGNFAIEELPASILLWRSFTQWIGGIGIVLVFVSLLPAMGITGKSLIASEQITVASETFQPRMLDQARMLCLVYALLTGGCTLLLTLCGMSMFDAVNHAFTALSTGGFSTRNASVAAFDDVGVELVLTAFMFFAGCNFGLLVLAAQRRPRALLTDPEFRLYVLLTAALIATIALVLWRDGTPLWTSLRRASFNVVSVYTSTGYATEDFQRWPLTAVMLLLGSMVVGACTGSTAGGIKVIRFLVVSKLIAYTVRHYVRPKSVERLKVGGQTLPAESISAILALVLLWFVGLFLGALVIALDSRLPFLTSLSAAASSLGCCGPSLCDVDSIGQSLGPDLGPMGGYGDLHSGTKLFLSFLMLLGRLEFLALLALLTPSFWRR